MATFHISTPDGATYEVEAPNEDAAMGALGAGTNPAPAAPSAGPSFGAQQSAPGAAMRSHAPVNPPGFGDTVKDAALSAGTGLVRGAANIPGMAGDTQRLATDVMRWAGDQTIGKLGDLLLSKAGVSPPTDAQRTAARSAVDAANVLPTSQGIRDTASQATGITLHEPTTEAGRFTENIGEFVPQAIAGGGPINGVRQAVGRVTTGAVLPGAASEVAGLATQGTPLEPYARIAGAVAGGGAGALLRRPGTPEAALRTAVQSAVPPNTFAQAQSLMADAAQKGVRLTWPEAIAQIHPGTGLLDIQRIIESSRDSRGAMGSFMADRPAQIDTAARGEFNTLAPASAQPSTVGPVASSMAEESLNDVRKRINTASEPLYKAAENVLLTPQEMAKVTALPGYTEAKNAIRSDPQLNRNVAHLPDESVGFLNEVKKYLDTASENAASPITQGRNMQRSAGYGSDAAAVKQAGIDASPDYNAALSFQESARARVLQPLLDGPLGKLAAKDQTTRGAINALFPANPVPGSQAEIGRTVTALAKKSPGIASQLVRAHVESVFNEAAQNLQSGANQFGGAKFAAALTGNPQQAANLEAAVRALPNGNTRWEGFQRFLDVVEATGKRQQIGSKTAFNANELEGMASGTKVGNVVKLITAPKKWTAPIDDAWNRWRLGRNLNQLAALVTDPKSAPMFERILAAKNPVAAQKASGILLYYLAFGQRQREAAARQAQQGAKAN